MISLFLTIVAILTPASHPSLGEIERGIKETLPYEVVVYNAGGNKVLMRAEIDEIIRNKYDLVITLGTAATEMTSAVFQRKGVSMPIVFTAVNNPRSFKKATGVAELLDLEGELDALLQYKREVKKLLLVYNPAEPGLMKDRDTLEKLLVAKGITLTTVEVFQTNEIRLKTEPFMKGQDALLVLKDNTVVAGLDALVKLSHLYKIPLVASDLDSVDKGATMSYGVPEVAFGHEAAKKAIEILEEKKTPPVTPVTGFIVRFHD